MTTNRYAPLGGLPRLARKAVTFELLMWRSLYRWSFRRRLTSGPEAAPFGYSKASTPIIWAFIALNAIEILVFHLLLPWHLARGILDVAGAYGLLWMLGLLASRKVNPHVLDPRGMTIRSGRLRVTIPWDDIATVRAHNRPLPNNRTIQIDDTPTKRTLSITVLSQTNVDVVLRRPTTLALLDGREETVTELRFYADEARALVAHARSDRPSEGTTASPYGVSPKRQALARQPPSPRPRTDC